MQIFTKQLNTQMNAHTGSVTSIPHQGTFMKLNVPGVVIRNKISKFHLRELYQIIISPYLFQKWN